jgi:hypothetical protein
VPAKHDESDDLLKEAQQAVAPFRIVSRPKSRASVADLMSVDGRVAWPEFGNGLDPLLATLAAEQRYLAEQ